ncbi:hypothetical protein BVC80_1725g29 [Macleaya cordata]|uniref:Transmembrane protein n=1 Tax=Macleaya cordata TaxID=56857 RepID=A0A200Q2Y5_MACCD|nr:hypothetical protein BVC80_5169g2 [Macleaya cordata]OVA08137.1 hypothetical protein BVC80_1725g29 [Macleaya cordata]
MVRQLKEVMSDNGGGALLLSWVALLIFFSLISAIIVFSCADGASKASKDSTTDHAVYGADCSAGCGAACGG